MTTEDLSIDAVGARNTPATPEGPIQYVNELTTLNLGPTHPATHGIFQNILQMDGEKIVSGEQTIGYIHRAFEKIAERRPFYQITTLTDRMNYCSSPINNLGWMMTVEKLLGVKTPKRADYIRVIMMELARISDHLICNGILGCGYRRVHRLSCICLKSARTSTKSMKRCAVPA